MGFLSGYSIGSFFLNNDSTYFQAPQYDWGLNYNSIPPVFMSQNNNFGLPPISLNVQPLNFNFNFMNTPVWSSPTNFTTTSCNMDTFARTTNPTQSSGSATVSHTEHAPSVKGNKHNVNCGYSVAKHVPKEAKQYYSIIQKYAKEYNVPEALVLAVITQESHFNPKACSPCGAKGLMQLMPGTAKQYHVTNVYDPEQNIRAGVQILSNFIKTYNGDMNKILAAYNWGPGNLQKKGLANMPKETRNYLAKVTTYAKQYELA